MPAPTKVDEVSVPAWLRKSAASLRLRMSLPLPVMLTSAAIPLSRLPSTPLGLPTLMVLKPVPVSRVRSLLTPSMLKVLSPMPALMVVGALLPVTVKVSLPPRPLMMTDTRPL